MNTVPYYLGLTNPEDGYSKNEECHGWESQGVANKYEEHSKYMYSRTRWSRFVAKFHSYFCVAFISFFIAWTKRQYSTIFA